MKFDNRLKLMTISAIILGLIGIYSSNPSSFSITSLLPSDLKPLNHKKQKILTIYGRPECPYCQRAEALAIEKSYAFEVKDVRIPEIRTETALRLQKINKEFRTVPQIFIEEDHLGGYDDLRRAEENGSLKIKLGLQ